MGDTADQLILDQVMYRDNNYSYILIHPQEVEASNSDIARLRFFYDVTFFIVVTTIGLNIVFGIIVDTFSELRDEKVTVMQATCFDV